MRNAKRTYTLSSSTVQKFESLVPSGQRSQLVDELLARRVDELESERMRGLIHEGLDYMADVYEETAREWKSVDAEQWPAQ